MHVFNNMFILQTADVICLKDPADRVNHYFIIVTQLTPRNTSIHLLHSRACHRGECMHAEQLHSTGRHVCRPTITVQSTGGSNVGVLPLIVHYYILMSPVTRRPH